MSLLAAAVTAVALALSSPSHAQPVPPFWMALGTCETGHIGLPDDGRPRFDWGSRHRPLEGHIYEGFVGFYYGTWQTWAKAVGVAQRYPHAYNAPPLVQVRVARYGLRHGGYWGCLAHHPSIWQLPGR